MKLKLRKLRKKREFTAHWKGGYSKCYGYRNFRPLIIQRRGTNTEIKNFELMGFITQMYFLKSLKKYYKNNLIQKAKKARWEE